MPNFKTKVINSNIPLTAVRTVEPIIVVFSIKTFGTDGIDSIISNHVKMTTRFCPIILLVTLIVERFSIGGNEIQLHAMETISGYHTVSFMNFLDLHVGTVWSLFDVFRIFQHLFDRLIHTVNTLYQSISVFSKLFRRFDYLTSSHHRTINVFYAPSNAVHGTFSMVPFIIISGYVKIAGKLRSERKSII